MTRRKTKERRVESMKRDFMVIEQPRTHSIIFHLSVDIERDLPQPQPRAFPHVP
jgi:hypothetical protein